MCWNLLRTAIRKGGKLDSKNSAADVSSKYSLCSAFETDFGALCAGTCCAQPSGRGESWTARPARRRCCSACASSCVSTPSWPSCSTGEAAHLAKLVRCLHISCCLHNRIQYPPSIRLHVQWLISPRALGWLCLAAAHVEAAAALGPQAGPAAPQVRCHSWLRS